MLCPAAKDRAGVPDFKDPSPGALLLRATERFLPVVVVIVVVVVLVVVSYSWGKRSSPRCWRAGARKGVAGTRTECVPRLPALHRTTMVSVSCESSPYSVCFRKKQVPLPAPELRGGGGGGGEPSSCDRVPSGDERLREAKKVQAAR